MLKLKRKMFWKVIQILLLHTIYCSSFFFDCFMKQKKVSFEARFRSHNVLCTRVVRCKNSTFLWCLGWAENIVCLSTCNIHGTECCWLRSGSWQPSHYSGKLTWRKNPTQTAARIIHFHIWSVWEERNCDATLVVQATHTQHAGRSRTGL